MCLNWVQFHGDETPEFCSQFNAWDLRTIKAIRVQVSRDIEQARRIRRFSLLFDAFDPNLYGGTGKTFDWSLIKNYLPRRFFLPAGLTRTSVEKQWSRMFMESIFAAGSNQNRAKKIIQK